MDPTTDSSTELSSAESKAARRLFMNTPSVALPGSGLTSGGLSGPQIKTVDDLMHYTQSIVNYLRFAMTQHTAVTEELGDLRRDMAAAGRILKLLGQAE